MKKPLVQRLQEWWNAKSHPEKMYFVNKVTLWITPVNVITLLYWILHWGFCK